MFVCKLKFQILSDEGKRKQYDTFGTTSDQMGMGGGPSGSDGFTHQWQYKSTIDPEELFRKIFGEAGFKSDAFSDFAESQFGFGGAQEVSPSNCSVSNTTSVLVCLLPLNSILA